MGGLGEAEMLKGTRKRREHLPVSLQQKISIKWEPILWAIKPRPPVDAMLCAPLPKPRAICLK